ncbi:MAG: ABC transporter ATP-binding protein [Anaerolineae bacterium]|nr:ABC transporter ATP-binding protein [Anaerolineae bacterium]
MGFFGSLTTEKYDRQYTDKELFQRAVKYFSPHLKFLTFLAVTVIFISVLNAGQPIIISNGLDIIATGKDQGVVALLIALLLVALLSFGSSVANRYILYHILASVIVDLSRDAFHAAVHHDLSFYDEVNSGKIVSRITSDTQEFGNLVSIISDVINQLIQAILLMIVMFGIEWRLTLLSLLVIPVTMAVAFAYRQIARKATQQGMRAMANVNSTIKETVSGIAIAKNFRQEHSIYDEFVEANQTSYTVNVKRGLALHLMFPSLRIIGGISTALLVYFGGLSAVQGAISIGAWYLFLQSLDRFLFPILNLSTFWTNIQNGLAAAERIFALIDSPPTVVQTGHQKVENLCGKIVFHNINFSYTPTEPVLTNFNLEIEPGETVAFVGHTGSGKTSIARLIKRFYEFQSGDIFIDGINIRTLDIHHYRRNLGIVSQIPFLFSGTVLDNIRYGVPGLPVAEVKRIASQIGHGEWLETLPNGLDTQVGERGGQLSMGQRQLVALMRVLVMKPGIFILDEATASIDPFTEWQIQQALNMIMAQTTSILIAHRLSTVRSADRIVTIEKGRIIEQGTHQDLLDQNGHYANLYQTYFRHQSIAYVEESGSHRNSEQINRKH